MEQMMATMLLLQQQQQQQAYTSHWIQTWSLVGWIWCVVEAFSWLHCQTWGPLVVFLIMRIASHNNQRTESSKSNSQTTATTTNIMLLLAIVCLRCFVDAVGYMNHYLLSICTILGHPELKETWWIDRTALGSNTDAELLSLLLTLFWWVMVCTVVVGLYATYMVQYGRILSQLIVIECVQVLVCKSAKNQRCFQCTSVPTLL